MYALFVAAYSVFVLAVNNTVCLPRRIRMVVFLSAFTRWRLSPVMTPSQSQHSYLDYSDELLMQCSRSLDFYSLVGRVHKSDTVSSVNPSMHKIKYE